MEHIEKNNNMPAVFLKSYQQMILKRHRNAERITTNSDMSEATLERLAKDENVEVRYTVARHENTPTATLDALAKDKNWNVRWAVAKNPNTSAATLKILAKDENRDVCYAVAKRCEDGTL